MYYDEELTLVPMEEEEDMEADMETVELIDVRLIISALLNSDMPVRYGIEFLLALDALLKDPEVCECVEQEF
jgi:hypothetical protein